MMGGLGLGARGFMAIAWAPTSTILYAVLPLLQAMSLFGPTSFALMTRLVGPSEQGQLQGAQNAIMGLTGLFGPVMFSWVFAAVIADGADFPGAAFYLAGTPILLSVPLALVATKANRILVGGS